MNMPHGSKETASDQHVRNLTRAARAHQPGLLSTQAVAEVRPRNRPLISGVVLHEEAQGFNKMANLQVSMHAVPPRVLAAEICIEVGESNGRPNLLVHT